MRDKIEELSSRLEESQHANCHPTEDNKSRRLTAEQHFKLWDEMYSLLKKRTR